MAPNDLIMLVSTEKEGDAYLVVTHDLPALRRFREWVESRSDPFAPKEEPAVGARGRVEAAFDPAATQAMPPVLRNEPNPVTVNKMVLPNEPTTEPPAAPPPTGPEPGEFTRVFRPSSATPVQRPPVLRNEPNRVKVEGPVLPNEPTPPPASAESG